MYCRNHLASVFSLFLLAFNALAYGDQIDLVPATAERIAYYAHMPFRETPFADFRGIYPITAIEARRHKHFRFVYDAGERPVEVT